MKTMIAVLAAMMTVCAVANETTDKSVETERIDSPAAWRLTLGGFGRGNIRTSVENGGADHEAVWGPELEVYWNACECDDFRLWLGMGGAFAPRQDAYSRRSRSRTSEHQVSDDGYTTYDFSMTSDEDCSVDLASGEFRLVAMPEWKVTESFSLAGRFGVAFDWVQAKYRNMSSWSWNSRFDINIPGILQETDVDSDAGRSGASETKTDFAAYGIVGLEATYMFTDNVGIYALCDWRIGDDAEFNCGGETCRVDMGGWYAGAGVVVQF